MDKKNTTIGVLLLLAAFAIIYFAPRPAPPPPGPAPDMVAPGTPPATAPAAVGATPGVAAPAPMANPVNAAFAAMSQDAADANVTTLSNDFVEARFSDFGGALREVALKKYSKELKGTSPYVFNEQRADPILAFVDLPGLDRHTRFRRVSYSDTEVVYRAVIDDRLEVTRRYVLSPSKGENTDPYQVRHETTFRNLTDQTLQPMRVALSLGTAAPNNANDDGLMLKTGLSNSGDQTFIPRSDLEASGGILGIGARTSRPFIASGGPIAWAAVKNKFFVSILTGDEVAGDISISSKGVGDGASGSVIRGEDEDITLGFSAIGGEVGFSQSLSGVEVPVGGDLTNDRGLFVAGQGRLVLESHSFGGVRDDEGAVSDLGLEDIPSAFEEEEGVVVGSCAGIQVEG